MKKRLLTASHWLESVNTYRKSRHRWVHFILSHTFLTRTELLVGTVDGANTKKTGRSWPPEHRLPARCELAQSCNRVLNTGSSWTNAWGSQTRRKSLRRCNHAATATQLLDQQSVPRQ